MKRLAFITIFIFITLQSYSQKITNRYLLGTWDLDTTYQTYHASINFIDSSKAILSLGDGHIINMTFKLDTVSNANLISLNGVANREIINIYWLVKAVNNDAFKVQGSLGEPKPIKWNDNETIYNTVLAIKRKAN
jgi:hypothetical protein